MKSQHLKDVTPEMRLEMQEKARLSRIAKREYAEAHLKTEYADMTYWKSTSFWQITDTAQTKHLHKCLNGCTFPLQKLGVI